MFTAPTHTIEFSASGSRRLRIRINGVDLIDLLREHELPFAVAERSADIAGAYVELPLADVQPALDGLLGFRADSALNRDGRLAVLGCRECGDIDCWGFYVRITVNESTVVWSDMTQPHRRKTWRYGHLGPFVFSRERYESALRQVRATAPPPVAPPPGGGGQTE